MITREQLARAQFRVRRRRRAALGRLGQQRQILGIPAIHTVQDRVRIHQAVAAVLLIQAADEQQQRAVRDLVMRQGVDSLHVV